MCKLIFSLSAVAIIFLAGVLALPNIRPPYIGCFNSYECPKNECCKLGMGRFSIPHCSPMIEHLETCSPSTKAIDVNVSYPDNAHVMLKNIYLNLCPCGAGLECSSATGTCTDPELNEAFNDLNYY